MYQPLIDYAHKELRETVRDVKISTRLVSQPVVIVADMNNDTPNRERIDSASSMKSTQKYHKEKNILELNPHAPIIQELNKIVEVKYLFTDLGTTR
jgi:HSP90 family molecular chaperone